jgi:hypothetical protein
MILYAKCEMCKKFVEAPARSSGYDQIPAGWFGLLIFQEGVDNWRHGVIR